VSDSPPVDQQDVGQTAAPEVVGRFAEREFFKSAVEELRTAGFERSDLSVLDTRESLSASESAGDAWAQTLAGLIGEVKYLGPLTAAGLIMIASGPVGAAVSGIVAAGITGLEAGSDIGASIRNPAHYCGVFGHKPTYGIVTPRGQALPGVVATTDIAAVGPLARSADDLALSLDVIAGPDEIAHTAVFLCSEEAGFITGDSLVIDGGSLNSMFYLMGMLPESD